MDSSEAFSAASSTEPASLVGDPGPGFDPAGAQARAGQLRDDTEAQAREHDLEAFLFPEVAEEAVRDFLRNGGDMTHALIGVGDNDWRATRADLDRIAPPATRILNRYQLTRAVAARSDEAALIIGIGLYGWRSMLERQAVLRELEADEPRTPKGRPVAAAPAPGSNGDGAAGPWNVVPGYETQAERMRSAQQRSSQGGEPREDQSTS